MFIPLTTYVLVTLTVLMLLTGIFWLRVPSTLRYLLIRFAIVMVLLHALFTATKWGTTSEHVNAFINWAAVAGYMLLLALFSRLSPRWLTSLSAIILLIPVFSSVIVIPLTFLFMSNPPAQVPLGNHLYSEIKPWGSSGVSNTGVDLIVYYRPPFTPFLRHKLQSIPFNDQECNTAAAIAIPSPSTKSVLGRCPNHPSQPAGSVDRVYPLH
jgi:hypothetical protein